VTARPDTVFALSRQAHGARNAVVHELDDGTTLVWELLGEAPEDALLAAPVDVRPGWLMRHDRIDFPPRGIAYRHTHPGPGIRYLVHGSLRIDGPEGHSKTYGPGGAWFEGAGYPVLATASETEETAFVRVLLLPPEWAGKRTIRYVDPADADRPKLQRPTVYGEYPIAP
jgi:quercetin dioxygenase-like cupin family protein